MKKVDMVLNDKKLQQQKKEILNKQVTQIDYSKVKSIADLVEVFGGMSIQARNVGQCAKIFEKMLTDKERPTILLGLAGPLIAAGLRKIIRDMIEYNMVDVIVSTGAIIYQDYYQAKGYGHYLGTPQADDPELRKLLINRIYDTYVDEEKFDQLDIEIGRFANELEPRSYSSREFIELLAGTIDDEQSIICTAKKYGVPIIVPALNDSSIGIGLNEHYADRVEQGRPPIIIDAIRDNYELTQIVKQSKHTAAFYVAGGVPKNFINDAVVMCYSLGRDTKGHKYAIQVTTASPQDGGLSGSTLSEAKTWGKVNVEASACMAFVEPSVSLPLIFGYAYQKKLSAQRSRLKLKWDQHKLLEFKV